MEAEIRKSTEAEIMKSLEDAAVLKQSDLQGVKEPYNRLPSQLWISHNPTVQSEKVQVLRKNRKLLGRERMSSDDVQLYKDFEWVWEVFELGMLMFKVAFSLFNDINQSACSTLDQVLNSQLDFDWVLYLSIIGIFQFIRR